MGEEIKNRIFDIYREKFPVCKERHDELVKYIPGGATRSLSYFQPFPIHIDHGEGAYVFTPEGHKLFDVTNAYGALIHGHGDPDIVAAVQAGIEKGSQYSTPTMAQLKLSKLLCERVPGLEKLRFLNSGTEATLYALRTARAYTKKDKILKMVGGFHGTHDCVAASTKKNVITAGIPKAMTQDVIEVPYNDIDALEKAVKENADELAVVIMEPFLGAGGVVLPKQGYLESIREITKKYNVLLFFDEIFSFRVHTGGCQALYNVIPDITTVGKVIGGGLPIGVFGGKEEIMNIYCHEHTDKPLYHSGTFNGYETVMQAGYAALKKYDEDAVNNINKIGQYFHDNLERIFKDNGLNIQSNHIGSYLNIHFVNEKVTTPELAMKSEEELLSLMHLSLLNKGIFTIPRALFILSCIMTEKEIDNLVSKIDETLKELLPLIGKKYTHLLL
jgi:glutamate-1-semialdehyde 2,1-aminomutase